MLMIALLGSLAFATPDAPTCTQPAAREAFDAGVVAMQSGKPDEASAHFQACLKAEPDCVACRYESGWPYWVQQDWKGAIAAWEATLALDATHTAARQWLAVARENLRGGDVLSRGERVHVPIGTDNGATSDTLRLQLVARFQHYNAHPDHPNDHADSAILSPKSVHFLADGSKVYVNALEGLSTVVYDPHTLTKLGIIEHRFDATDSALFYGQSTVFGYPYLRSPPSGDPNVFGGKPVEMALSHGDRWLWVPYYRRDWDVGAGSPSAVAIIDTRTDQIVRVMPTGPIPKYVTISPDQHWAAITHWGDNTLMLIDISSGDPARFTVRDPRLIVGRPLPQQTSWTEDRDHACGFCLRGTVFTPDSQTLLVARMGGGGIAGFDVASGVYLGTIDGMRPTPRHLVLSPDGVWLYLTSNVSGVVSKIALSTVVSALRSAKGAHVKLEGWAEASVGAGARTLALSPDGQTIYVAVHNSAELVALDAQTLRELARVRTDSFTVGLAVSPDGTQVWTTSQGQQGVGGNSVCVYAVTRRPTRPEPTAR